MWVCVLKMSIKSVCVVCECECVLCRWSSCWVYRGEVVKLAVTGNNGAALNNSKQSWLKRLICNC